MLQDPLRYILTLKDGLVKNYDNLPTNVSALTESVYENPGFTRSIASSVESDQANGAPVNMPTTTRNLDSYSNLSQIALIENAAEYDDVIVPQADTFDKVCTGVY